METVNISFDDFNTSTRGNKDTRRHETAQLRMDPDGGYYVVGQFGCGKTRPDIPAALTEYLGGRSLVSWNLN